MAMAGPTNWRSPPAHEGFFHGDGVGAEDVDHVQDVGVQLVQAFFQGHRPGQTQDSVVIGIGGRARVDHGVSHGYGAGIDGEDAHLGGRLVLFQHLRREVGVGIGFLDIGQFFQAVQQAQRLFRSLLVEGDGGLGNERDVAGGQLGGFFLKGLLYRLQVLGSGVDFQESVLVFYVLGLGINGDEAELIGPVLVIDFEGNDALGLEVPGYAAGLAKVAAAPVEGGPDLGGGAVSVGGQRLEEDGAASRDRIPRR